MEKRGISALVATVLIILITIAGVTIIWAVIVPMIKENVAFSGVDADLTVVGTGGYTVYDALENVAIVQIKRGADEAEMNKIEIIFSIDGESYKSIVDAPKSNQALTYGFNFTGYGKPESVSVAPIFVSGNMEKVGIVTSKINVPSGRIVNLPAAESLIKVGSDSFRGPECVDDGDCDSPGTCEEVGSGTCSDGECVYRGITSCIDGDGCCPGGCDSESDSDCECVPNTCASLGYGCGTWDDGCGGSLSCEACGSGYVCESGNCVVEDSVFTLYLSPSGNDDNSGLIISQPIKTLVRAQQILKREQPQKNVEIRIKQGTYSRQYVHTWNYYNKDYSISFMPEDYVIGTQYNGELPTFDGEFIDNLASDSTGRDRFFILYAPYGKNTNINFYYLKIKRYINGISLEGSCSPEAPIEERNSKSANNNKVIGCIFEEIGNGFTNSETMGTQALSLWNSQNNLIENNTFSNLKNTQTEDPYQNLPNIHGVYVMCNSKNNVLRNNYFHTITGDPIRFRDYSENNIVEENIFIKAGFTSFVTDWYNDNSWQMECPSFNNIVRNNQYSCGHWPNNVAGRNYDNLPLTYTWPTGVDDRCILGTNRFIIGQNTKFEHEDCLI